MPNWCSSYVSIDGSVENIQKIREILESTDFSKEDTKGVFETLIGRDENITEEEYENGGWYDHNTNRYGCKWDIGEDIEFQYGDEFITFSCQTAWSPPTGFCKLLSEKYQVKVRCEFEEPGCHFAGHYEIDADGNESEETLDYLEGIHKNDEEHFDHEIRSRIEYSIECEETFEDFIEQYDFKFLGDNWKEEIKEIWDEVLEEMEN